MRMKKTFRTLVVFMLIFCMLSLCAPGALAVSQYEINQLALRREALAEQAREQAAYMQALAEESALFAVRKLALDQCIVTNEEEIELLSEQIELYNRMLEEKSGELNDAIYAEERQSQQLRARMRAMEETSGMSYLSVLLESASLSELLGRLADIADITRYDRALETRYRNLRENREQIAQDYQQLLSDQQNVQAELAEKKDYLNEQIAAAADLVKSLEENSANAEEEYAAIDAALNETDAQIQAMILALQAEYAAQRAAAAPSGNGSGTGASTGTGVISIGDLIWPIPSSGLVTSQFGNREQPTAGASTNHQGLDINANEGDAVVAAGGGTVISAGNMGGYGNCVIIDHGNGVQTVYAHLSEVDVTVGQTVGQGDLLGGAGHTGIATGDHLHYEVRENGVTTDPSQFYTDYDIW